MAPVCSILSNPDYSVVVPGCLAHPTDDTANNVLHNMASSKVKESMMELNRQVVEVASRESLPIKLSGKPGRVTTEQLEAHISHFRGTKAVKRHSGLLQIALAAVEAQKHVEALSRMDSLLGVEKGLLQTLGEEEGGPSPLSQVTYTLQKEMGQPDNERLYTVEHIFMLLLYLYSILENSEDVQQLQEEQKLQNVLVSAIMDEKEKLPEFLQTIAGDEVFKEKVILIVQDLFEKLKSLSRARTGLQQFRSTFDPGSITSPACLRPLVKRLIQEIFDSSKPELGDIVYKSTGYGNLLKSGFGLFRNVSKPRPSDHPTLIVFIIGGTTITEVRQIREAVLATKTNVQVVVGSTCLTTPRDLLQRVLAQDNLHPQGI